LLATKLKEQLLDILSWAGDGNKKVAIENIEQIAGEAVDLINEFMVEDTPK